MALTDFDKILKEYKDSEDDFGFSAVSEKDYNSLIKESVETVEAVKHTLTETEQRLMKLEKMIIPFLKKLHSTGDKEYIYWPNRKPVIEKQIEAILKLTRG
jgi:septal ring factor EnvC (AmiA/AmiB activator)